MPKNSSKQISFLYLFVTFLVAFSSCTGNQECRQNRYVMMEAGLYHVSYNDVTKTYTTSVLSFDSLTVQGFVTDSITGQESLVDSLLYNNARSVSKILLPLSKFSNASRFILDFKGIHDTLTIYHTNNDQYLSLECGCIKIHNIDTILTTHNFIDSVKIIIHNVNTTNAEHIHLYN